MRIKQWIKCKVTEVPSTVDCALTQDRSGGREQRKIERLQLVAEHLRILPLSCQTLQHSTHFGMGVRVRV